MRVKICGITNIEDALLCSELGADALGFIFYEKSKRYIEPTEVKKIIAQLPPFVATVGVFVNETAESINKIADLTGITFAQLHGVEDEEFISRIKLPAIKAYRISNEFDFNLIANTTAEYILLDSFDDKEYGGTGKSFDWSMIPEEIANKIILAGGVSVDNIEMIYNKIHPTAVDLSSSVEEAPGKKSKTKVKEFFEKVDLLKKK